MQSDLHHITTQSTVTVQSTKPDCRVAFFHMGGNNFCKIFCPEQKPMQLN